MLHIFIPRSSGGDTRYCDVPKLILNQLHWLDVIIEEKVKYLYVLHTYIRTCLDDMCI